MQIARGGDRWLMGAEKRSKFVNHKMGDSVAQRQLIQAIFGIPRNSTERAQTVTYSQQRRALVLV
jgi:hypothetical protein